MEDVEKDANPLHEAFDASESSPRLTEGMDIQMAEDAEKDIESADASMADFQDGLAAASDAAEQVQQICIQNMMQG